MIAGAGLWLLETLGIKGIAIVGGVLALSVLGAYEIHHQRQLGIAIERARIEKANHDAEIKALGGQTDVDRCYSVGGNWDRASGMCQPARK